MDCARKIKIFEGLFNKVSHEGVSSDSGRWIKLERAGLKEREREREEGDGAQASSYGKNTVATMAGATKLTGATE